MAVISLYETIRDRFLAAVTAVDTAPENMDDDEFAELVFARNRAARALAGASAEELQGVEVKRYALGIITCKYEAGSYGDGVDVLMSASIQRDLDRLAPGPGPVLTT